VSTLPHFYYSPGILNYCFGPSHPLKPERLRRTLEVLAHYGVEPSESRPAEPSDLHRVHDPRYVEAVRLFSIDPSGISVDLEEAAIDRNSFGFGAGDNPAFQGMWEASLAYVGATATAAEAVRNGADLAFGIGGGLHHARRDLASGFCIFNDCAIACHILREHFRRVAYVDIDVHHGDGVQGIFYQDPTLLTCSIHEEGRTLYPGTGFVEETGTGFSSLNVPLQARTSGDVWLDAFERGILPALERFQPEAIVLQMGTDTHYLDPLGHISSTAQHWLGAVRHIKELSLPIVALGGGGYNLTTVPRMWAAACLTLGDIDFDEDLPEDLCDRWGIRSYFDTEAGIGSGIGAAHANQVIEWLGREFLPNMPR